MIVPIERDDHDRANARVVQCDQCRTPVFEVRDGLLIIRAKHHGEWHTSIFRIDDLLRKAA